MRKVHNEYSSILGQSSVWMRPLLAIALIAGMSAVSLSVSAGAGASTGVHGSSSMSLAQAPAALRAAVLKTAGVRAHAASSPLETGTLSDPGAGIYDEYGATVAVSGTEAVVGAPGQSLDGNQPGTVYFYSLGVSGWTLQQTIVDPSNTIGDGFGEAVAISGSVALIGASGPATGGEAYFYTLVGGGWGTPKVVTDPNTVSPAADSFGSAVAISGTNAVIGAWHTNGAKGAAYFYSLVSTGWARNITFSDPANTSGDEYGYSVAVSGTSAVVGAYANYSGTGAAYFYAEGAAGWTSLGSATNPSASGSGFGDSVAISGTSAVIGAGGANNFGGAAYVYSYQSGSWDLVQSLSDPQGNANDDFGYQVAVSDTNILVGADGASNFDGVVYQYSLNNTTWVPTTNINDPGAATNDFLGSAIALSGDSAFIAVSANNSVPGEVYTYDLASNVWAAGSTFLGSTNFDNLGVSVAISGDNAVVGAPGSSLLSSSKNGDVYFYSLAAGVWHLNGSFADPNATSGDRFGASVSVSGTWAVVGAPGTSSAAGETYFYILRSGAWTQVAAIGDPQTTASDDFGSAVAISGTNAVVGAPGGSATHGVTYFYSLGGAGVWSLVWTATDPNVHAGDAFGSAVAMDGINAVIGSPTQSGGGAVNFFQFTGTFWESVGSVGDPAETSGDDFGNAVAISATTAVIGADNTAGGGAVTFWSFGPAGWYQTRSLADPANTSGDGYGYSVALSGTNAVVGSWGSSDLQGAAYAYHLQGIWKQTKVLANPYPSTDASFGFSVAVAGQNLLVGASVGGNAQGQAQFYYEPAAQYIVVPAAPSGPWNSPLSVATTSTSGLSVSYGVNASESSAPGCSVSVAGLVTATGGGTCSINLTQAGTVSVASAAPQSVVASFTAVSQAGLLIATARTLSDARTAALVTAGGSGSGVVSFSATGSGCVLSGAQLHVTRATSCSVTATKAATVDYLVASSPAAVLVFSLATQAVLKVTNKAVREKVGQRVSLSARGGSGPGRVSFTVSGRGCALKHSSLRGTKPGRCVVRAHRGSSTFYRVITGRRTNTPEVSSGDGTTLRQRSAGPAHLP